MQITKNRPVKTKTYSTRKESDQAKIETLRRKQIRKFKYQKH